MTWLVPAPVKGTPGLEPRKRQLRALPAMVVAIALCAPVSPALAATPGESSTGQDQILTWSIDGSAALSSIDLDDFHGRVLDIVISSQLMSSDDIPSVTLGCSDRASGEGGTAVMPVLGRRLGSAAIAEPADVVTLSVATGEILAGLPYPIEPLRMASKPSAIIAQLAGRSVIGIEPAVLRDMYRETAAYMLATAGHHYPVPYGDGLLDCRIVADGGETVALSPDFTVRIGRGLPMGTYPRDHTALPLAYRPWWVADPALLPTDLREGIAAMSGSTAAAAMSTAAMRAWDDGSAVAPWIEIALDVIASSHENPVRASRGLAMVAVAANDALVALESADASVPDGDARSSGPLEPLEHAVVAGAVAQVLRAEYPAFAATIDAAEADALAARRASGVASRRRDDLAVSIGTWAADLVLERGRADGSTVAWGGSVPNDGALWVSSIEDDRPPLEPMAGAWQPWNLINGAQFRPPEPPRPGDAAFERELQEVLDVRVGLTRAEQQIASQWQDKDGSLTPAGHWTAMAIELLRDEGWSTSRAALLMAVLATAQADAFIAAWDSKFAYWSIRPVSAMKALAPDWRPYVETPHFPSYVSGHATTSGAAGAVLATFFPAYADELSACAQQAADSRLLGGIHFRFENVIGLGLGRRVATIAVGRVSIPDVLPPDDGTEREYGCLWPGAGPHSGSPVAASRG